MQIKVELNEDQARRLKELAEELAIDPKELARAALTDLLSHPAEDFQRAADHVIKKNRELYERLS